MNNLISGSFLFCQSIIDHYEKIDFYRSDPFYYCYDLAKNFKKEFYMITQTDIDRINLITSQIKELDQFISEVKKLYLQRIEKIYIVFEKSYQVEFKGALSQTSTAQLLQIILSNRDFLRKKLETRLTQCMELIHSDQEKNKNSNFDFSFSDDVKDLFNEAAKIDQADLNNA